MVASNGIFCGADFYSLLLSSPSQSPLTWIGFIITFACYAIGIYFLASAYRTRSTNHVGRSLIFVFFGALTFTIGYVFVYPWHGVMSAWSMNAAKDNCPKAQIAQSYINAEGVHAGFILVVIGIGLLIALADWFTYKRIQE